ncbi:hypothetical protein U27_01758 [Candidatus Vecturithrix granuli]|uniref:Uncharacterized protein n=1 Tax=Vecturithrix granuli TaxID=1499967 RepID=A0A0S6W933_VECG1|nr:hypothetical protein U27_01758 [Candidatus Vecturithrix granuli]
MIYTIPPEFILNYQADTPLEDMIAPTSIWCFPVLVNGESCTLLMVDLMDGVWKALGIGSSGIAKQWAAVNRVRYSAEGYTTRFVRIFQATADFVILSHRTAASKMIPLESARATLELDRIGEKYAPSKIIPDLQQTVRENLEASKSFILSLSDFENLLDNQSE